MVRAVDDVSFDVAAGELVGYLGPNGAGKSTTIKMLTGILTPPGAVSIGGLDPDLQPVKALVPVPEGALANRRCSRSARRIRVSVGLSGGGRPLHHPLRRDAVLMRLLLGYVAQHAPVGLSEDTWPGCEVDELVVAVGQLVEGTNAGEVSHPDIDD